MKKTLLLLLALTLLGLVHAQADPDEKPCWGQDCDYNANGNPAEQAQISDIVPTIDKEVRRVYWYYLRKANLLYQANIDTPERFINFFIYRNVVGTFLVIASWTKETQESEVNTFVRLGNGYSEDIETPYSPVDIDPFIISLRLSVGEFLIEMDEDGNFQVTGTGIQIEGEGGQEITEAEIDAKAAAVDEHVRKNYWYYLDKARLIHQESILTTRRLYVVLTYVNIVGTFLVIGSCDENDVVQVNTFVRLGAGSAEDIRPITIEPAVFTLQTQ